MKFQSCGLLIAPLIAAFTLAAPSLRLQQVITDDVSGPNRHKVPGDNPAHFTRVKGEDQLLTVYELDVSPYPFATNSRVFFHLGGHTLGHAKYGELPGLASSILEIHVKLPDQPDG
ncbi:hypothetical protein EK21DRAFT_115722 [Setomelanomma holmii]|uniref:Uncharacterized protein n=1 Tax=Setomelanomma holmii TaxID=210430 RepID=A0A9P4H282_9PLEO|nr:hypothetical protein EK21DRAFT_115722 [Setomelanomma holmii]